MALIKSRILSKSQLLNHAKQSFSENRGVDEKMLNFSMAAHMLADGASVKVYDDRDMGGTVVEYNDGN